MGFSPHKRGCLKHQLGKKMGIQTIAEFAENTETLDKLKQIGVDFAHVYAIKEPHPLDSMD